MAEEQQVTKVYKGPSKELQMGDEVFEKGDNVTASQAFFDTMTAAGHHFADEAEAEAAAPTAEAEVVEAKPKKKTETKDVVS